MEREEGGGGSYRVKLKEKKEVSSMLRMMTLLRGSYGI